MRNTLLFALFVLCLAAVFLVVRRLRIVAENAMKAGRKEIAQ